MGKLIDLTGLGEFKTKLLNLIKPQLDASVSTVNSKSATNHAVVINADDIKMSSSENVTIPNKLKQYVKSVNGSTPDPITGDVVVAGGGGDTSVGLIRRSIGIATTAWQGSGPFTYTYSDPDIAVGMCVLEAYLSDEYAQLGINSYTIQNGSLIISTTVKPTADWNLTIALGMDGSTFMEDVSDLKTKVGNGTIDTTATTLIGAVNELNARKGSGITVSDTDSRSIATAITEQSKQILNLQPKSRARLTDFDLADLQAAVADQNLEKHGLKPGDQKTINGHTYVIAGLNPMKGSHFYTCKSDHVGLIVIPHTTQAWNASGNTYTGANSRGAGYMNSDLHYYLKNTVIPMCNTDLGSGHLYAHRKQLSKSVNTTGYNRFGTNSGCSNSSDWEETYISALTEMQVYGGTVWSSSGHDTGEADQQLEVFQKYKHTNIFGGEYPWLRDVASASDACYASDVGHADYRSAGTAHYVAGLILYH